MKLLKFNQGLRKSQLSTERPSLTARATTANLSVFLLGTGQIAKALVQQIAELEAQAAPRIRLLGVANSRKMLVDLEGIGPASCHQRLAIDGKPTSLSFFLKRLRNKELANPILVDCTASEEVSAEYCSLLQGGICIVTPNKRANAGPLERFERLRAEAELSNVHFLYETTVGAGLPIVSTLQDLLGSGDDITRIEAVLSGTLSYVFNSFGNGRSFSEVIREAKALGYTEPDPREDLSGQDVGRKLLILAREMNLGLEIEDLSIESLVPQSCESATSVEEFLSLLEKEDSAFEKLRADAEREKCKLRYIGKIENGNVSVKLESVSASHPFFGLAARDNIVSFTTRRYSDRPLVVQGPGAGTNVTAAGVLADILRIGRRR